MPLSEVKKSQVDSVHFDEKILLITQTLNWFAVRQEKIFMQIEMAHKKGAPVEGSKKGFDEIRSSILKDLTKVMEDWGNWIDGHDSLDEVDSIVTEAAYDVVNERYQSEEMKVV